MSNSRLCTGYNLSLDHLWRVACRLEEREVANSAKAHHIVYKAARKAGIRIVPALPMRRGLSGLIPNIENRIFFLKASVFEPDSCDDTVSEEMHDPDLSRMLDWFEFNGLPEIKQMNMTTAWCKVKDLQG